MVGSRVNWSPQALLSKSTVFKAQGSDQNKHHVDPVVWSPYMTGRQVGTPVVIGGMVLDVQVRCAQRARASFHAVKFRRRSIKIDGEAQQVLHLA